MCIRQYVCLQPFLCVSIHTSLCLWLRFGPEINSWKEKCHFGQTCMSAMEGWKPIFSKSSMSLTDNIKIKPYNSTYFTIAPTWMNIEALFLAQICTLTRKVGPLNFRQIENILELYFHPFLNLRNVLYLRQFKNG